MRILGEELALAVGLGMTNITTSVGFGNGDSPLLPAGEDPPLFSRRELMELLRPRFLVGVLSWSSGLSLSQKVMFKLPPSDLDGPGSKIQQLFRLAGPVPGVKPIFWSCSAGDGEVSSIQFGGERDERQGTVG